MTAVAEKKPRKKYTADDFAGMWNDEYFMDVDELNKLIRDGRHVKSNRYEEDHCVRKGTGCSPEN